MECARLVPKEQRDKYYERMLKLLYREKQCDKHTIIYYLMSCSLLRTRDIINFAMDEKQDEEDRYIALWAVKASDDKFDFVEELIQIMRGNSYRVAIGALDIVMHTKIKPQKLFDTYMWLQEKYKDDRIMRSAVNTAIKVVKTAL